MELYENLQYLEEMGTPIRVGLVGCGQMGSSFIHVTNQMAGMETVAVSDILTDRAVTAFKEIGIPEGDIIVTNNPGKAEDAIRAGKVIVTQEAIMLAKLEALDAVVEATGLTEIGASVAYNCIMNSKHVIMLNVETDVTVGPILHRLALKAGCVYTAASGDEPGVCKMLYNFAAGVGLEVVCLGKGKNNPIDHDATPESCREEAERKGMNPKMLAAFKDGSKTMVELAAMCNATGLLPDIPGMHGPKADVDELNKVLIPAADGGVLSASGRVDYSTGKVAPGVFAIVTSADDRVREDFAYMSMGDGPYYTLYRPFHLTSIETPVSVAEAVIYGESTVVSRHMVAEVAAVAKRDLSPGDVAGQIGQEDFFGRTYEYVEAGGLEAIPLGLVPGGTVTAPIAKGELLTGANFTPDAEKFCYKLRKMQDAQLAMES